MPLVPVVRSRPVSTVLPTWRELTIVFRNPGGDLHTEDGIALATLAVHPSLGEKDPPVTVTHLPTKLAIAQVDAVDDAVAFAEQLWSRCADAFKRPGEDVDKSKISPDVVAWIKQCIAQRRCVK